MSSTAIYRGTIRNTGARPIMFTASIAGVPHTLQIPGYASMYTEIETADAQFKSAVQNGTLALTGTLQILAQADITASGRAAAIPEQPVPSSMRLLLQRLDEVYLKAQGQLPSGMSVVTAEITDMTPDARSAATRTRALQAEMEAGTADAPMLMTPLSVRQAIDARLSAGIVIDGGSL